MKIEIEVETLKQLLLGGIMAGQLQPYAEPEAIFKEIVTKLKGEQ